MSESRRPVAMVTSHPIDTGAAQLARGPSKGGLALHLAWTAFQRRQVSMAEICELEAVFLPVTKAPSRWRKAWSYLGLALQTFRLLAARRPEVVWVQLPQVPLLWVALVYRALSRGKVQVVADCHNAQLRDPWVSFPLAQWSLARADVVLVHNHEMLAQAQRLGWPRERLLVLEDVPPGGQADRGPSGLARKHLAAPKPWVVFPGSFAADEPIAELLQAARLVPEATFIITGRTENAARRGHDLSQAPANVVMPGFLPVDVFDDLLRESDCVLALTREEGIQLSVCNEALGFGRALVASDTVLLRELFGEAAVMVPGGDPAALAAACRQALDERVQREALSSALAKRRSAEWQAGPWAEVCKLLASRPATSKLGH